MPISKFGVKNLKTYGKLSGRTELKEHDAQSRIDQSDHKRGWNDFALWKFKQTRRTRLGCRLSGKAGQAGT